MTKKKVQPAQPLPQPQTPVNKETLLTQLITENIEKKQGKSMAQLMTAAGYTLPEIQSKQSGILIDIQAEEPEILSMLADKRRKLLMYMNDSALRSAKLMDQIKTYETIDKIMRLSTGQETERKGIVVNVSTYGKTDPLFAALQNEKDIIEGEVIIDETKPEDIEY